MNKQVNIILQFSIFVILTFLPTKILMSAEVVSSSEKSIHLVPKIDFYPQELKAVEEKELRHVSFGITWENTSSLENSGFTSNFHGDFYVTVTSENPSILEIINSSYPECIQSKEETKNFSFVVKGVFLGYAKVTVNLTAAPKDCKFPENVKRHFDASIPYTRSFDLSVSVVRPYSVLVDIVTGVMAALVAFNYINMGVQLDLHAIGKVLKKPIGPAIGFVCQFLFMPLVSIFVL